MARTLLIVVVALVLIVAGAMIAPVKLGHIQLAAEPIGHLGGFAVTNTMIAGWLSTLVVLFLFWRGTTGQQLVPRGIQNFAEFVAEFVLSLCESVAGVHRGRQFFPLVATIFLFVITSNWMGLLPGYNSIVVRERVETTEHAAAPTKPGEASKPEVKPEPSKPEAAKPEATASGHGEAASEIEEIPLLRAASTDLNTTLAIALVSVVATQIFGLRALGGGYVSKFINFRGPIDFYVGILELIAEFAKIISFTFRLFGNVFAGEVLLAVIVFLIPWGAAIPFYGLELFVGFIQAFVFAILTLVFMTLATTAHEHGGDALGHHEQAASHH